MNSLLPHFARSLRVLSVVPACLPVPGANLAPTIAINRNPFQYLSTSRENVTAYSPETTCFEASWLATRGRYDGNAPIIGRSSRVLEVITAGLVRPGRTHDREQHNRG